MSGRRDEVQQAMNSVVSEASLTSDAGFFGKNIVVLTLKISNDFLEARKSIVQG